MPRRSKAVGWGALALGGAALALLGLSALRHNRGTSLRQDQGADLKPGPDLKAGPNPANSKVDPTAGPNPKDSKPDPSVGPNPEGSRPDPKAGPSPGGRRDPKAGPAEDDSEKLWR